MCSAEVRERLNTEFNKGAAYRWVWHWQHLDGRREISVERTMGQHEAKLRAEREHCLGLGYQYVPGNAQPVKVALVFPRRWVVNYAIHKAEKAESVYQLFRKVIDENNMLTEQLVEDLTGQFPECFQNIRTTDVQIGCIH